MPCITSCGISNKNIKFYVSKLLRTRVLLVLNTRNIQAKIEKASNEREQCSRNIQEEKIR